MYRPASAGFFVGDSSWPIPPVFIVQSVHLNGRFQVSAETHLEFT